MSQATNNSFLEGLDSVQADVEDCLIIYSMGSSSGVNGKATLKNWCSVVEHKRDPGNWSYREDISDVPFVSPQNRQALVNGETVIIGEYTLNRHSWPVPRRHILA